MTRPRPVTRAAVYEWVLGYGSLVEPVAGAHAVVLAGARRGWTVAMDNTVDLPGYKHYVDARGDRPDVAVAFLDLVPDDDAVTDGLSRPVTVAQLAALDRRERQYERIDVTDRVGGARGRTWTYVGSAAARARAARARADGRLVIARVYLEVVRAGFSALDAPARARCEAGADPGALPVVDLVRVDHPG